jgi:mercuric ion transport protein
MAEQSVVLGTAGGALGLGALAAAVGGCCAAPWAVALLGVTGAVALARLTFLLPYALGGAIVLLGVAFWSAYRPLRACADGACASTTRRSLRIFVWIATALVAAFGTIALVPFGAS